jgi:hypothetical protein
MDIFPVCAYLEKHDLSGGCKNNKFMYLFIVLIIFLFYVFNSKYSEISNKINNITNNNNNNNKIDDVSRDKKKIIVNIEKNKTEKIPTIGEIMRKYDYRTLNDPLVAPRRRDDYNLPVLPIPTRGFPSAFKKVGLLIDKNANNDEKYKILLLMGRNKYPNSTSYEYYAVENDKNSVLKFDINKTRELQTGDHVEIHEINKKYTVVIDKILGYEYDPYLY